MTDRRSNDVETAAFLAAADEMPAERDIPTAAELAADDQPDNDERWAHIFSGPLNDWRVYRCLK